MQLRRRCTAHESQTARRRSQCCLSKPAVLTRVFYQGDHGPPRRLSRSERAGGYPIAREAAPFFRVFFAGRYRRDWARSTTRPLRKTERGWRSVLTVAEHGDVAVSAPPCGPSWAATGSTARAVRFSLEAVQVVHASIVAELLPTRRNAPQARNSHKATVSILHVYCTRPLHKRKTPEIPGVLWWAILGSNQ